MMLCAGVDSPQSTARDAVANLTCCRGTHIKSSQVIYTVVRPISLYPSPLPHVSWPPIRDGLLLLPHVHDMLLP